MSVKIKSTFFKHLLITSCMGLLFLGCMDEEEERNPMACFDFSPKENLKAGDTIRIVNCSENSDNFKWSFGDGSTSNEQLPFHVYEEEGSFTIHLEAINGQWVDTLSKMIVVVADHYIDLQDVRIMTNSSGSVTYDLDIDKDSIIDLSIIANQYYSSMFPSENFVQLIPQNHYELAVSDHVDTTWYWNLTLPAKVYEHNKVKIPKIFNARDTIKIEGDFTSHATMIIYGLNPGGANANYKSGIYSYVWLNFGLKYIALRKRAENNDKLAWVKLQVFGYNHIVLNSCNYFEKKDEVIIKDR